MRRRVLVLGATGMLGHKVAQRLRERFSVIATVREPVDAITREILSGVEFVTGVDAYRFETIERAIASARPDVVVNCIGVIKQLQGAKDPIATITINALLPHQLHRACTKAGAHLVHFSTDCVFSGHRGNYVESDTPDPVDLYGRTKLLGEVAGEGALTLRTSIIGRELRGNHGLVEWFLSQRGKSVRGFRKAIYTGVTTLVAATILEQLLLAPQILAGLWQVASDRISKYELLGLVNKAYGLGIEITPDDDLVCDRSMKGDRFTHETGIRAPSWSDMVAALFADTTPYRAP